MPSITTLVPIPKIAPPIVIGNFIICQSNFKWQNQPYEYDVIRHLTFYWKMYTVSINGLPVDKEEAFLEITLSNGQKFKEAFGLHGFKKAIHLIPFGGTIFNAATKAHKNCTTLAAAHRFVAQRTFEQRFLYYRDQLRNYGYFLYDNNRFFSDVRIEAKNMDEFHISNDLLNDGKSAEITLTKNKKTLQQLAHEFGINISALTISTKTDGDVFYALLEILKKQQT